MDVMGQKEQSRKLHRMHAESFDPCAQDWRYLGSVLLPNYASRAEVAHVLKVFGLDVPVRGERVSWSFMTFPGPADKGPRYLPKASIYNAVGTMIVRLSPHVRLPIGKESPVR